MAWAILSKEAARRRAQHFGCRGERVATQIASARMGRSLRQLEEDQLGEKCSLH